MSDISCNKEYFDKAAPTYNDALKISGFNESIEFASAPATKRSRNKQIICFHPSYSVNKKINIGRIFLWLMNKHFLRHHKYCKSFNRKNMKINYSCMSNMASVIGNHNTSLLEDPTSTNIKDCSCSRKSECPFDKKCLFGYLEYNASVDRMGTWAPTKLNINLDLREEL